LKPAREHATNNGQTYFVTSDTWERRALFHAEPWARLFFKTLLSHRSDDYLLHQFVLMPDHFHILMTPFAALEHSVQLIKGGFSYLAKMELGSNLEVWQRGFADHRIRDFEDYDKHVHYIHLNPVKKHLCTNPGDYKFSSAYPGWTLDPIPQGLKPEGILGTSCGTTEVVPFQNNGTGTMGGTTEVVPFQNNGTGTMGSTAEVVPFQSTGHRKEHDNDQTTKVATNHL
jgi:putative transposase